jgi:hypothetical protein
MNDGCHVGSGISIDNTAIHRFRILLSSRHAKVGVEQTILRNGIRYPEAR